MSADLLLWRGQVLMALATASAGQISSMLAARVGCFRRGRYALGGRHAPQRRRERARDEQEHGADALVACANVLRATPREQWPDAMLMVGDQVYVDEVWPVMRKFIEERRDTSVPPGHEVRDFTEYCFLYRETWSEPSVRWLLSVLPSILIFDDHDVHDDWNISSS